MIQLLAAELMEHRAPGLPRSALPPCGGPAFPGLSQEASSLNRDSLPDATRLSNLLLISTAVVSKLGSGKNRKQAVSLKCKWIQCT